MPDWSAFVRQRLRRMEIDSQREEEVRAELAEFLEDAYQDALARGLTHIEAQSQAEEQVRNWRRLRRRIRREEEQMTPSMRMLWLPGVSMMLFAAILLMVLTRILPPAMWVDADSRPWIVGVWGAAYLLFGAVGAYWSKRLGGGVGTRFLAGILPAAMHLGIYVCVMIAALVSGRPASQQHLQIGFALQAGFGFVLLPAIVLAIGTLPFLRGGAENTAPSGTPRVARL